MLSSALVTLAVAAGVSALATPPKRSLCPDGVNSAINPQCCSFFAIRDSLINDVFEGVCGENAHSTIRIAFHDAIGFSLDGTKGGGADGSMIAFGETELAFSANAGIDDIVTDLQPFAEQHGITFADVIHFGSSVALSLCPGAPTVQTFVGRPNATHAAPDKTVPDPFEDLTSIFNRMAEAGFTPADLVALLASHSVAAQDEIDPPIHGSPFDSTPGTFDNQVFLEVQLRGTLFPGSGGNQGEVETALPGEFRLQSDHTLARDSRTACVWQSFALDHDLMASKFSEAMVKLNTLGHAPGSLIDCTEVIQPAPPLARKQAFFPPGTDHSMIEQACATAAFPTTLSTAPGPLETVAVVAPQ